MPESSTIPSAPRRREQTRDRRNRLRPSPSGAPQRSRRAANRPSPVSALSACLLPLLLLAAGVLPSPPVFFASSLPLQVKVRHGEKECFLERLAAGESVTFSAIVLQGDQLRAQVQFDGPIYEDSEQGGGAGGGPASSAALRDAMARADGHHHRVHANPEDAATYLHVVETLDFEHLKLEGGGDEENRGAADDDYAYDDDTDGAMAKLPEDERQAAKQKRREERERKKQLVKKQRQDQRAASQTRKIRFEGDPMVRTLKTTKAGWYRYCLHATYYAVTIEFDLRKESDMGGLNEEGDVLTHEERLLAEEDKIMAGDTAAEEGIRDEDFAATKDKLKTLRRLLAEIQSRQQQERHRLTIHSQTNEHSHSRMVLGSLLETLLFMVVTGVQVATIRRWFKGAPVLGR